MLDPYYKSPLGLKYRGKHSGISCSQEMFNWYKSTRIDAGCTITEQDHSQLDPSVA